MKTVSGITMTSSLGNAIAVKGVVSNNGRYVVSALARLTGEKGFKPGRTAGSENRIDIRLDIALHEWDDKQDKQGDTIIPLMTARVMTNRKNGVERQFFVGIDNPSNRQYKNLILSDEIWKATEQACALAIDEAISREIEGKRLTIVSNVNLIGDASRFAQAADIVAQRQQSKITSGVAIPAGDSKIEDELRAAAGK